jgi:hypothetical protein
MRLLFLIRLGIAVNVALALLRLLGWLDAARRGEFWRADFSMFYTGFAMVRDGQGASLYDLDAQLEYQRAIAPERGPEGGLLPFNYPPHAAVPAFVLAYLPRDAAFYAWSAIQLGLLLLLLRQLLSWMSAWPVESRILAVSTVVAFPPVSISFELGQVSLLILVSLVGLARALESRRDLPAACWLVLATIKPQLAIVPAMVLVADRRWRVLTLAAALFVCWAGAATLIPGPAIWPEWLAVVRHSAGQAGELGIFPQAMYNLKGLLFGLLGPDRLSVVNRVSFFALLAGVLLPLVLWRLRPSASPEIWRLKLAFCLQIGLLVNPHFNPADAVAFVLPAVLYVLAAPRDRCFAATAGLLALCPLLFLIDCFLVPVWPLGVRPFFVAMALLAVALGAALERSRGSANRG